MAYWGPADGHVAGRNTSGNIRVLHEVITVDMRDAVGNKTRVFADYRIQSQQEAGFITFLFVASAEQPVKPEIILDGKIQTLQPRNTILSDIIHHYYRSDLPADSLSEIIGLELETDSFHRQPIFDILYEFTLYITPGEHRLKVGYELEPTGFDLGDIHHFVFPYYLGNKFTRPLYDSIFVHVLLPEGMEHGGNIPLHLVGKEWHSQNIAGFKKGHIYIDIYKNVNAEISRGWNILVIINITIWILLLVVSTWFIRHQLDRGRHFLILLSSVLPLSFFAAIVGYISMEKYYRYFEDVYGTYLRGSWGKDYYFLIIPFIIFIGSLAWLAWILIYRSLLYGKPYDPFRKRKKA